MKGQKRSQRRGVRMGIYDRFLHVLHHLDIAKSGRWPSPERIDELLKEANETKKAEMERPRVRGEIELYKQGWAPKIIFTGGFSGRLGRSSTSMAKAMANDATALGIPKKNIILEEKASFTIENARFSKGIIDRRGWRDIVVVTSGLHLPRTKLIFKRIFGKGYRLSFIGAKDPLPFWQLLKKYFEEFKRIPRDIKTTRKIRKEK